MEHQSELLPTTGVREIRSFQVQEFRVEKTDDGKQFFTGYAALYNSLSEDLGGWRERILPGAFTRSLANKAEVHHLINHDEALILGNTASGTTELTETDKGLFFKTLAGTRSYEKDLIESMERKDIAKCSFAFAATKQDWVEEADPETRGAKRTVRELADLDLFDVSIVARPAYMETSAQMSTRSLFPDGVMPVEIRSHLKHPAADGDNAGVCMCDCDACKVGDCAQCSNAECDDENCVNCPAQNSVDDAIVSPTPGQVAAMVMIVGAKLTPTTEAKLPFFNATTQPDGTLELLVYQDIGESWYGDGVTAQNMKNSIDQAGSAVSKLRLRINSFGGDAFEGVAIHNMLKAQGKPIEVCIDGLAASAASIIAMCGDTITMPPNAMMMVHNAASSVYGYASDMRQTADVLDKVSGSVAQTYVSRTGKPLDYVQGLMDAETWMSAEDCVKDGFATAVQADPDEADQVVALAMAKASPRVQMYRNLPARFKAEVRTAAEVETRAQEIAAQETANEADEKDKLQLRLRSAALVS